MKTTLKPALLAAALMGVIPFGNGCATNSSTPSKPFSSSSYDARSDFGGETVTDGISRTATVIAVDRVKRLVVLKRANGSQVSFKALPNAFAFDEVKVGDVVKVTVTEQLAVFVGRNNLPAGASADTAKLRVRLPGGTQAVAAEVGTLTFTARIIALDNWNDAATLQLADGTSKTIRVSEAVNLADFSVGDSVTVQATESTVVLLEKP
jgi:hypothetical protein